ncbi:MAG TPA: hypothetical protein GX715_16145 [Armatimonadetes bacterium]|jgi:hypothetical protein|nr:hypothetical protein [Armatimonadota bacterium]
MQYGSLQNLLAASSKPAAPEAGMGATEILWTDRVPYTITRVDPNGRRFWMKEDKAIRVDSNGMGDAQSYRYEGNPDAPEKEVTLRSDGRWKVKGSSRVVAVGFRERYRDFRF